MQMGTPASFAHLNELFKPSPTDHVRNEVPNTIEGKMWDEYMKEGKTHDERDAHSWKQDANGLLVFTGLFSATVGAFIIEFYKKLSPDNGERTVGLLCQISQQLPNFPNGTCSPPRSGQSFSPAVSIVLINSMWTMSLILSLTSALFATLLQQWARRYVQMPEIPGEPTRRARVRSFLFFGTRKFHMRAAVEVAPTLLHLSVFLFFVGLAILFYTIHRTVAIVVTISVGIFVVAYFALTILPYIYHNCPYRTPMSNIWWYASHFILFITSCCLYRLLKLTTFREASRKHRDRLEDGFKGTIMKVRPSDKMNFEALTWWVEHNALVEERRAQDFLSCLPDETVVKLMHDPRTRPVLDRHLHTLLRRSRPSFLAIGLDDKERKNCLLVYLRIIHCIAHDFVTHRYIERYSLSDVNFVRSRFAEITHMQDIWDDDNAGIRVTSRSICALLARSLLQSELPRAPELGWLEVVIRKPSATIFGADIAKRGLMNLKAFVYGVLMDQRRDFLAKQNTTLFTETLAILMDAGTHRPFTENVFRTRLTDLVRQIDQDANPGRDQVRVVETLCQIFRDILPAPGPGAAQADTIIVVEDMRPIAEV